ncbi:MAG: YqgE/AlgH family protein [bacterium]|jgi:putative transcriptional regulator
MINPGSYIKSTEALNGTFFEDAIILIIRNNDDGATGFVVNKHFGRSLNDLEEFRHAKSFPLLEGGPVDPVHIYILHNRPDLIKDSELMLNGLYVGGDIQQVIDAINANDLTQDELKLFIGYCGWDAGELESEVEEGSWVMLDEHTML